MQTPDDSICYLNGEFTLLSEARISPLDRGFIFGDGIYEVIPVFEGKPFQLNQHLARLHRSLSAALMPEPLTEIEWNTVITELIARNGFSNQTVYLQITRGVAPREHAMQRSVNPTVFLMSNPLDLPDEVVSISAQTMPDFRWQRCDIKTTSLMPNVLSREIARQTGAREAIYILDGYVTEGAASNVFACCGGRIVTPPLSPRILPGVTRDLVVQLLRESGAPVDESPLPENSLRSATEIWVTSSSRELVPVVELDGGPVGDGLVGPIFKEARELYQAFKQNFAAAGG